MNGSDVVFRVAEPGRPAFRLRPGEEGISVFVPASVDPILPEAEVLNAFGAGSVVTWRSIAEVEAKGLIVVAIPGAPELPPRLQVAHAEIRPGPGMSRREFKHALKELE